MREVERDPGFATTPPGAAQFSKGRRLECIDASGDVPETFREFSVPWPDQQVIDFYRTRLISHGWVPSAQPGPISGAAFSKTITERTIELSVVLWQDNDNVTVSGRTDC